MAKRRFRPRTRKSANRDMRLIIIATEGTKTEPQYFTDLAFDDRYRTPRVHIEVLEAETTASSPRHVMDRLNSFQRKYELSSHDELWLVIDVDTWSEAMLSEVAQQALQKGYHLAVSTPCFELWLLLHLKSLDEYSDEDIQLFVTNKKTGERTRLETELVTLCGSYSKNKLETSHYIPYVETAISNAKTIDTTPEQRWINGIGTRVYLLVQSIIESSRK